MTNAEKMLVDSFQIDKETQTLINQLNADLYSGPSANDGQDNYPGFVEGCKRMTTALDPIVMDYYMNLESEEITEREPQEESAGDMVNWIMFEAKDVLRLILGRELAAYFNRF